MGVDEAAFQGIYDAFRPKIQRHLTRMVGEAEAEDLTQEVFLKASRAMDSFRGEAQLSTWLYRIATNVAIDRLRSPSARRPARPLACDAVGEDEAETADRNTWTDEAAPAIEQQVVRKEMNRCIRQVVEELPEDYRRAIIMGDLADLKNGQIAGTLGISLDTAKIRLHRARTKLRRELQSRCQLYYDERNELACDPKATCDERY